MLSESKNSIFQEDIIIAGLIPFARTAKTTKNRQMPGAEVGNPINTDSNSPRRDPSDSRSD